METLEILSPLHIGSGENYYGFTINNGKVYSIDDIFHTIDAKRYLNSKLLDKLANPKISISRKEFCESLGLSVINYQKLIPLYDINQTTNNLDKLVNSFIKTTNQPFIPGSTIKGFLLNLIWFDIINNEPKIKSYLERQYSIAHQEITEKRRTSKKPINFLENQIKEIYSFLKVRDINISDNLTIYDVKRFSKGNQPIPVGLVETLDTDVTIKDNIISTIYDVTPGLATKIIDKKILHINESVKMQDKEQEIVILTLEAFNERIKNIKKLLSSMNERFMKKVLSKEIEFIHEAKDEEVDKQKIITFYKDIEKRLSNKEIIIQIGKYTNYLDKTCVSALSVYESYFQTCFRIAINNKDKKKEKTKANIASMNLACLNNKGKYPFGFIKLSFND